MKKVLAEWFPITLFILSVSCFVMGLLHPILKSSMFLGLKTEEIYLWGSIRYFFEEGEWFIALLLLIFTFLFPILKYVVILFKIVKVRFKGSQVLDVFIEIINKWAMLDVFVVALIIINMKMSSIILVSKIRIGTTYFAASVLLLMICSLYLKMRNPSRSNQ